MQHSRCHKGCHRGPDATIEFDRSLLGGLIVVGGEAQFTLASLQVFVFVLVGVIAVIIVGMVILGGMLLSKNKDNKGADNSSQRSHHKI
jgi:hypothetical protein